MKGNEWCFLSPHRPLLISKGEPPRGGDSLAIWGGSSSGSGCFASLPKLCRSPLLECRDNGSPTWSRTLSNSYSKLPTRPGIFSLLWSLKLLALQISAASKLCQLFPPCFSYLSHSSPAVQVLLLSYPPICYCPHMMLGFLPTEFSHHFSLSPEPSRTPLSLTTNSSAFSYFCKPFLLLLALSKTHFAGKHSSL